MLSLHIKRVSSFYENCKCLLADGLFCQIRAAIGHFQQNKSILGTKTFIDNISFAINERTNSTPINHGLPVSQVAFQMFRIKLHAVVTFPA
jgi:hypothetical protein